MATARLTELLSRHPAHIWTGRRDRAAEPPWPTGHPELDTALSGGWPVRSLVEIHSGGPGLGDVSLLLPALAACTRRGQRIAWLPEGAAPHAPALLQSGMELRHLLVAAVAGGRERLWAAEQCLRSGACAAVVIAAHQTLTDTLLRRLKLAASAGGAVAFLLLPESAARRPSPATLRVRVRGEPGSPRRCISILKYGGHPPRTLSLDLATHGR